MDREIEILDRLKKSIVEYDAEGAASWARESVKEKMDPVKALDAMTEVIRKVGDAFGRGELWLPDLIGAAEAMSSAMPILEEEIERRGSKKASLGTVVAGTVYGDIHSIGKTMVCVLLKAEGFTVHDLGVNVPAEEFIGAIKEYKADILVMSALLTTTAPEQRKVVAMLEKEGLREEVKIMVGGAAVTEAFAHSIGADGYDPTALGAAKLARKLIENEGNNKKC